MLKSDISFFMGHFIYNPYINLLINNIRSTIIFELIRSYPSICIFNANAWVRATGLKPDEINFALNDLISKNLISVVYSEPGDELSYSVKLDTLEKLYEKYMKETNNG